MPNVQLATASQNPITASDSVWNNTFAQQSFSWDTSDNYSISINTNDGRMNGYWMCIASSGSSSPFIKALGSSSTQAQSQNSGWTALTAAEKVAGYVYKIRAYSVKAPPNSSDAYWTGGNFFAKQITITLSQAASCSAHPTLSINDVTLDYTQSVASSTYALVDATWSAICSQSKSVAASTNNSPSSWSTGNSNQISVLRGTQYYFHARSNGVSGHVSTGLSSAIPYLQPKKTGITISNAVADATTGEWSATVSGVDTSTWTNYAAATSASSITGNSNQWVTSPSSFSNHTVLYNTDGADTGTDPDKVSTGVNGTVMTSTVASNAPATGQTVTYYLWCSRQSDKGGSGGVGWNTEGWEPVTGVSFTVSRATSYNEGVSDATGTYYDNYTGTGAEYSVTFTGLDTNKYYQISNSNGDAYFVDAVGGTQTSYVQGTGTTTKVVRDESVASVTGTNTNTTTYYLWRADDSNGTNVTNTGVTYTRTLAAVDRASSADHIVGLNQTEVTTSLGNTIAGHVYRLKKTSASGTVLATVTATGTTTNFTYNIGASDLPYLGNSMSIYFTGQSSQNSSPAAEGLSDTVTLTRSYSSTGGGAAEEDYGLVIKNAQGNTIYDTTSRLGRMVAFGDITGVTAGNWSSWVSVTGLTANSDGTPTSDFTLIVSAKTENYGTFISECSSTGGTNNGGRFRVKNTKSSGSGVTYSWILFKQG